MDAQTIATIRGTWKEVAKISPQAAALFYKNLFEADPALQRLFKGDMEQQGRKLMQMIGAAVSKVDDLPGLVPILHDLSRRHAGYGVEESHYATVGGALLKTLGMAFGDAFTPSVREAWAGTYGILSDAMITAARSTRASAAPSRGAARRPAGERMRARA